MAVDKPLPNRRLLVVDPDLSIAREVSDRCERIGFECFAVNRSKQALEIYLHKLPAVVLVEMLLPDGNGLDLIREIRTFDWSHTSRIYVHSFVRGSVEIVTADAKRAGANGLFPKPFDEERLLELAPLATFESSEASQYPYDVRSPTPEPSTDVAHADTLLDTGVAERESKFGPAGLSVSVAADPEPEKPVDLAGDLDLGFDDDSLSDDTELDAWLEGLASGGSSRRAHEPTAWSDESDETRDMGSSQARPRTWTPTEESIVTIEGDLTQETLLAILAAAWREDWFGRIRVESGRLWTELSVGEGLLWTVTCDETGPSVVDVGFRHGLMAARELGRLADELRDRGERSAAQVLRGAGVTEEGVARILELTAIERVMSAFESHEGSFRCHENLPPTSESFEARLPLSQLISMAVDRHVPVMRAVDRFTGREREVVRKGSRFGELAPPLLTDRFSADAEANLVDGETLLDWIQKNPSNPSALFLLLTKLIEVRAVTLGLSSAPPTFTFGRGEDQQSASLTAVTIPATPKQTSKRMAEISDAPFLQAVADTSGLEGAVSPEDGAPHDPIAPSDEVESPVSEETPLPLDPVEAGPVLVAGAIEEDMARSSIPEPAGPLEGAGFAASIEQLRLSGELPAVEDSPTPSIWHPAVLRSLDRWDLGAAHQALQERLIEAPEDTQAAAYEAWIAFARAVEGGGGADPGHALSELEQLLEAAPSCPVPYYLLGLAAISLGNNKQAVAHLDAGLGVAPADPLINVAAGLTRAGYYEHPKADRSPKGTWRTVRRIAR